MTEAGDVLTVLSRHCGLGLFFKVISTNPLQRIVRFNKYASLVEIQDFIHHELVLENSNTSNVRRKLLRS